MGGWMDGFLLCIHEKDHIKQMYPNLVISKNVNIVNMYAHVYGCILADCCHFHLYEKRQNDNAPTTTQTRGSTDT